ncbi:intraflagellar transport protein 52 homolog [Plasmopara halstedii]|uniref:Intraflagellar transport protein 52 homolog n=1 Tax=Plasmopara halstedii TaxID=4781 RepID=A0A0P1APT5_PLAHL|nr:intraflagellar transport protein 52 homolog [Plasmopara halstedii]CEG43533.1 intraflagellar transport protein 52 homolog [Plasmopara halstedii]|eukprot:XP_024579902.1 intraflagellar transport protein 52 homolog [Plasmopara halstedii]
MERQDAVGSINKSSTVLFDASKKEQFYPASGLKKLARRLKPLCRVDVNKDDLSRDRIKDANVLVFAGVRERFSSTEFATLKDFLSSGGSILLMLGEGGEQQFDTNLNGWLKDFGIFVNPDAVIRTVYHKYHHPKEVLVSRGVVNRELTRMANELFSRKDVLMSGRDLKVTGSDGAPEKDQKGLSFVYPYGATLNVKKPAATLLSSGSVSYPVNRPVAAAWQERGVAAPASKSGRLIVFGSTQCFVDEWIDKEENAKLQEIIFRWLLKDKTINLNHQDAEDPDLNEYVRLPDTQALSDRLRSCMQESEELPKDFTRLFDDSLFKFDTSLIPEAVNLYHDLGVKHEPLTLIPPQFECPLPPLKSAVFPPALREPPPPALDQFDLDEHFASETLRLAQLTNKCSDEDLEYYVRESADILGIMPRLNPERSDAKHILEFITQKIVSFKKLNQDTASGVADFKGLGTSANVESTGNLRVSASYALLAEGKESKGLALDDDEDTIS